MSEAEDTASGRRGTKRAAVFRTIGEVAEDLELPAHVLRFWESKFPQLKPLKRGGGRRYYRPEDIALLSRIRQCLYQEGYTIRGVQKLLADGTFGAAGAAADVAPSLFPLDPLPIASAASKSPRPVRASRRAPAPIAEPEEAAEAEETAEPMVMVPPMRPHLSRDSKAKLEAAVQDLLGARQMLDALLAGRKRG